MQKRRKKNKKSRAGKPIRFSRRGFSTYLLSFVRRVLSIASIAGYKASASSSEQPSTSLRTRFSHGASLSISGLKINRASIFNSRTSGKRTSSFGFPRPFSMLSTVRFAASIDDASSLWVIPLFTRASFTTFPRIMEYSGISFIWIHLIGNLCYT